MFCKKEVQNLLTKMLAFAILPVALLAGFAVCMPASEPACSRFDYEEKLLAKTIRLEVTVEDLTESVTKFELTQQALEVLANKVDKIEAKCDAFESKKQEVMEKTGMDILNIFIFINLPLNMHVVKHTIIAQ